MFRGFVWAIYVDDFGREWGKQVDADYASDPDRGWTPADPNEHVPLPRGWRPRCVVALDDDGNTRFAIIGSVAAPLWTGAVDFFLFEADDLSVRVAHVIATRQERLRPRVT